MLSEGLLDQPDDGRFRLVAGVDPAPRNCKRLADLSEGVPVYPSLEDFYRVAADLAVLSSPIHQHCRQTLAAHGSTLCEAGRGHGSDGPHDPSARPGSVAIGFGGHFRPIQRSA